MQGKKNIALVTGRLRNGIGFETALILARNGFIIGINWQKKNGLKHSESIIPG